jgi:glycine/D-amino acid oxidase-like deaminating enzyme
MPIPRRSFLAVCAAASGASRMLPLPSLKGRLSMTKQRHVVVVGAGAFGGWTALWLRRGGARVTLLDAWGPGNSRASSGGETRVIRATYGARAVYTRMAARALTLWKEHAQRWQRRLYHPIGVLWLVESDDQYEQAALPLLAQAGVAFERLSGAETARRYPQINCERVRWAIFEREGGYLTARAACAAVLEAVVAEGGEYRQLAVRPGAAGREGGRGELGGLQLSDGTALAADAYVFACGPWLGRLFPDVIGERVRSTRQEVYFFGTPAGDRRFTEEALPVWADHGSRFMYGIPGNEWRGFKVADDTRGPAFDPDTGERMPTPAGLAAVREYLGFRFPELRAAPLVEARVCQYENSPDEHFIVDRHPAAANAWLVGGGSGHGFKHGPALGELVARLVLTDGSPDPEFRLSRFGSGAPPRG